MNRAKRKRNKRPRVRAFITTTEYWFYLLVVALLRDFHVALLLLSLWQFSIVARSLAVCVEKLFLSAQLTRTLCIFNGMEMSFRTQILITSVCESESECEDIFLFSTFRRSRLSNNRII